MAGSEPRSLPELRRALLRGLVIPAHPLALTADRGSGSQIAMTPKRYMFGLSTDAAPAPAREAMG